MLASLRTVNLGCACLGVALCGSACSPAGMSPEAKRFAAFAPLETGHDAEAQSRIARVVRRYSTARAYSDRGTAILTTWSKGERFTRIGRFRTEFVRGRTFVFRYYEESGALNFGIWASGSTVRVFFDGTSSTEPSVDAAIASSRGITSLSSWLVPTMLFGGNICASRVALAGEEHVACGNCSIISVGATDVHQQLVSVDIDQNALRRFRDVAISRASSPLKSVASDQTDYQDDLLTYEPTFDEAAERQFGSELDRPPW